MKKQPIIPKQNVASKLLAFMLMFMMIFNVFAPVLSVAPDVLVDESIEIVAHDVSVAPTTLEIELPEAASGGNILHAWNMRFNEIIEQLPYIAEAGFNTIQTSPIGDAIFQFPNYGGGAAQPRIGTWWMLYQPRSFNIGNMLGTEAEFRALTAAAAEYGIGIIVDAVPNHTTGWWDMIDEPLRRPELFHATPGDGSIWDRNISNWGDRAESRRARLLGLMTFNTGSREFQELYMEFLGEIIDAGATGFRYDAMVHIELPFPYDAPGIASDFWPVIQRFVDQRVMANGRSPFQYGEILHRWHADYLRALPGMGVTACGYGYHLRNNVLQGRLGNWAVTDFFVAGGTPDRFVTWVESHDHYGNAGTSRNLTEEQIRVGWAIMTARYGTTPLFLVRPGSGFVNDGQMFSRNADGSYRNNWGHSDFYRDPTIVEVNWFANYFINQPEHTSSHFDQVALIERGPARATTGVVIVNAGLQTREVNFPVQMVDGEYMNQITGDIFTVRHGRITGPALSAREIAVIHRTTPRDMTPRVFATPGSSTFLDAAGMTVTLGAHHTTAQSFTVSGSNGILIPETTFIHGQEITIGYCARPGDVFILTVTGTNGTDVDTQSFVYTKGDPHAEIRIELAHHAWNQVRIWGWHEGGGNIFSTDWNNAPLMVWDNDARAWVFTVDSSVYAPFNIMFHNGQGQQLPAEPPYWTIYESTRIEMVNGNPVFTRIPTGPQVNATPGETTFYSDDGITVTLNAQNTTAQTFMMTDASGLLVVNATPFTNGQQVTIGAGAFPGDRFMLILSGTDGNTTVTETFVYTRAEREEVRIEFAHGAWNQVRIWGWHEGGGNIFRADWFSAPLMTWDSSVNAWVYTINRNNHPDFNLGSPFNVMFHNGQGQQLPARAPYWLINGSVRIEMIGGVPVFTPL